MRQWRNSIKEKAKQLRKKGYSYGQLTRELGVSKSTLHAWIRGIRRPEQFTRQDRIRWIKEIQPLGAQANKKKREKVIQQITQKVHREVSSLKENIGMKKTMLAMMYWAEGSKVRGVAQFVNIDPRMNLLFITLLRQCYDVDESKFRIRLHLHYYHRVKIVRHFWSHLLHVPEAQFEKTYRKPRSKEKTFRKNFGGICFVKYNSVYLKEEILQYAYSLSEKFIGKIAVPVA